MTNTRENVPLDELAAKINTEHAACLSAAQTTVEKAIEIGQLLTAAKEQVDHGEWSGWVTDHCRFGIRQAQRYMRFFENRDALPSATCASHLTSLPGVATALVNSERDDVANRIGGPEAVEQANKMGLSYRVATEIESEITAAPKAMRDKLKQGFLEGTIRDACDVRVKVHQLKEATDPSDWRNSARDEVASRIGGSKAVEMAIEKRLSHWDVSNIELAIIEAPEAMRGKLKQSFLKGEMHDAHDVHAKVREIGDKQGNRLPELHEVMRNYRDRAHEWAWKLEEMLPYIDEFERDNPYYAEEWSKARIRLIETLEAFGTKLPDKEPEVPIPLDPRKAVHRLLRHFTGDRLKEFIDELNKLGLAFTLIPSPAALLGPSDGQPPSSAPGENRQHKPNSTNAETLAGVDLLTKTARKPARIR
jgi:hypothetical protein